MKQTKRHMLICLMSILAIIFIVGCSHHNRIQLADIQDDISSIIEENYLKPCPSGRLSVYSYVVLNSEENSSFHDKLLVNIEILQQFYSPFLSDDHQLELFHEYSSTIDFILSIQNDKICHEELPSVYSSSSQMQYLDHFFDDNLSSNHYDMLLEDCQQKAYHVIESQHEADSVIESLFDSVVSSASVSSSPAELFHCHPEEWNQLIQMDYQALDYCFREFLKKNQTDLKGQLMMMTCQAIIKNWNDQDVEYQSFHTGQEWFDAYYGFSFRIQQALSG